MTDELLNFRIEMSHKKKLNKIRTSTYVLMRIQESNIEFARIFVIAVTKIQAIFAE